MSQNLCDTCKKADSSCPVWYPSLEVEYCVEWDERSLIDDDDPEYIRLKDVRL